MSYNLPPMSHAAILVRHGEVENPDNIVYADLPGFGLSERGFRQAESVGQRLSSLQIAAVYASPLQRATETAAAIADEHRLTVIVDPNLTEWGLAVRWKGLAWDELDVHFPGDLEAYLSHPWDLDFNPEPLADLADRMSGAVGSVTDRHPGETVVVVSHQDPIQAARLALTGRSLRDLADAKPQHAEAFFLSMGDPWRHEWRWAPPDQAPFPPQTS